jgi:hypothetical protein
VPAEPEEAEEADEVPADAMPAGSTVVEGAPAQAPPVPDAVQPVPIQARRVIVGEAGPLLADAEDLASSWSRLKAGFVDNPRGSVVAAADLVEDVTETLVAALRARQDRIRDSWDRDSRDTESLRQALLTYQGLFNRITDL